MVKRENKRERERGRGHACLHINSRKWFELKGLLFSSDLVTLLSVSLMACRALPHPPLPPSSPPRIVKSMVIRTLLVKNVEERERERVKLCL